MPTPSTLIRPFALVLTACVLVAGCGDHPLAVPAATLHDDADAARRIEADLRFLADDLLEGRQAGTRGYDLAARYVEARFRAMGLEPGGDAGGYLQAVPMVQGLRIPDGAELVLEQDGQRLEFAFERDFLPAIGFDAQRSRVSAPVVFVGHGVHAPEFDYDDFAGIEVEGKIALMFNGAPARFPNDPRAFHSSGREKLAALAARGAVGAVMLSDPEREERAPWARGARNWLTPGMRLLDEEGRPIDTFPELQVTASASLETTRALLAQAPGGASAVFENLEAGTLQAFDLAATLTLSQRSVLEPVTSHNVVAMLPGTDPELRLQHVVFSAHLDHVGIGAPADGDRIYNGAYDNALGTAIMLEAARMSRDAPRPRRSLVFIAVTAEEKGLLGAHHFARQPGLDGELVANLNMDMPLMFSAQDDVVPYGIEHSSLRGPTERAAARLGVQLSPDPMPEEVIFVRSDQYAFVRQGIPALYLDAGIQASEPGVDTQAQAREFLRNHYHQPSDQADLPIHYPTAVRLARLNQLIGSEVADADERPAWNEGNFFGERFARP